MSSFQPTMGLPPLSAIAAVDHASTAAPSSNGGSIAPIGPSSATEYRDARIKDPIPKKLKGHTGHLSGNFGIMQMDLGSHESPLERDEQAKRASESTELAAMRAYQSGHGVSSTKRFVRVPDDPSSWDAHYTTSTAAQASGQSPSPVTASQSLTPADIKNEQTRLLTLLRGLSPSSVVDQICKALSYFGGSPGAPPPTDGVFPRSELSNGSGGAFVGWIAEIFPRLANETLTTAKSPQQPQPAGLTTPAPDSSSEIGARRDTALSAGPKSNTNPAATSTETPGNVRHEAATEASAVPTEKRRRGRPKGSKATKARRDKGIKKGPVKERKALAAAAAASAASKAPSTTQDLRLNLQSSLAASEGHGEDSWVDVDDDNMLDVSAAVGNGLFFSTETSAALAADSHLGSDLGMGQAPGASAENGTTAVVRPAVPNTHTGESGKKRGRPKGSKNRPKAPVTEPSDKAPSGGGPVTVTQIPLPTVPDATAHSKKPKAKKQKVSSTKTGAKGVTAPAQVKQHAGTNHENGQATELPQLQGSFGLQSTAADLQHGALLPPNGTPAAVGSKRKRPRVSKQDSIAIEPVQVHSSAGGTPNISTTGNGSHTVQHTDQSHVVLAPSKKQRKLGDTSASVHNSTNGSASPAPDMLSNNAASDFGQADISLGANASIMQTLDPSNGTNGSFNAAAAFEALSTHLEQDPPVSLAEQHQQSHESGLSSLNNQQLSAQGRQSLHHHNHNQQQQQQQQQQPLTAQKPMSLTPPFHTTDRMQGQGRMGQQHASQHQTHPQVSQHHGSQNQQNQQMQQLHSHQHVSGHASSSTPLQHNPQTQMSASLSTGSLAAQQLPRPNRVPQAFYAQSRTASNSQFGQALPQPLQHSQQQQQHQKQHFNSQYQSQGTYPSQPQQHQAFTPQQRQPSQNAGSGSPGLLAHGNMHRSPQFAAPNATAIRSGLGTYGANPSAGTINFNPPTYDQNRRQSSAASPSLGHTYGAAGAAAHTLSQQGSASFMGTRPQHSPGAAHQQGVGGVTQGMQSFHGFDSPSLFDGINLDTTGSGSGLGLSSSTAYGLGGSVPRTTGNVSGFGSSSSTNSFDASIGGGVRDRFYDTRR